MSIPHEGSIEFVRADFYTVEFGRVFDVVCYWDGFGVGSDDDQIRLLRRIAHDWLGPDGRAIIEVFDPAGWAADDGLVEIKEPAPERGYEHRLGHCRSFEAATSTAVDAWWEVGSAQIYAQRLRCYEHDEFVELARRGGLTLETFVDLDAQSQHETGASNWSCVCVLRRTSAIRNG